MASSDSFTSASACWVRRRFRLTEEIMYEGRRRVSRLRTDSA
jgi:hypothetical protein